MSQRPDFSPATVIEVAHELGITRGDVQAQLRLAEGEGEVDAEPMLNALRALLIILERAESAR